MATEPPPQNEELAEASVNLGPWLQELHKRSGLSNRALAQAIGVERTNLKGWLDGKGMTAQNLLKFLSAVGARIEPPLPDGAPQAVNAELQALRIVFEEARQMEETTRRLALETDRLAKEKRTPEDLSRELEALAAREEALQQELADALAREEQPAHKRGKGKKP